MKVTRSKIKKKEVKKIEFKVQTSSACENHHRSVAAEADPGFDLRGGGVEFVNWGGGGRTSLKMFRVEVKSHF